MRLAIVLAALLSLAGAARTATAQFKDALPEAGPKLGRETVTRIQVGVIIKAQNGAVSNVVATAPVPTKWPEQHVSIVKEDVSSQIKHLHYRKLSGGGGLEQMVVEVPQLAAGQEARALITFEVTRTALIAPDATDDYHVPKKPDRTLQVNLGPSPYIESRHPKIVAAAKSAVADQETDWQKAAAIFAWVRDNVAYKAGDLKGAARALHDNAGDTDELVSLFVAMCRAQKIPARTVFVLGHAHAEFYLEDADDEGHWFPCQLAGVPQFGGIDGAQPILQKGDNFKNPENPKERQRFVSEYFHAAGRGGKPHVEFISELAP